MKKKDPYGSFGVEQRHLHSVLKNRIHTCHWNANLNLEMHKMHMCAYGVVLLDEFIQNWPREYKSSTWG